MRLPGRAWPGAARPGEARHGKTREVRTPVRRRHHGAADGLETDQHVVVWLHSAAHGKTRQEMK